ncbi:hypothetical protein Lal_00015813 [Lupinus albus]|nr:hypothetical protein Lal_00015813 [Lupinus albus]
MLDGLEEFHSIEVEINHVNKIDKIFGVISYRKYASIIRMLQSYLGIAPNTLLVTGGESTSYNSLISYDARKYLLSKSSNMFDEMLQRGTHPDVLSYNILMNYLFKLGKPDEVNRIFMDIVLREFRPSPTTYNVMINGLCKNVYVNNALARFRNLQRHEFIHWILTYNDLINGLSKEYL